MPPEALGLWIEGTTRSGKTTRLIQQLRYWATQPQADRRSAVFFAASGSNRQALVAMAALSAPIQAQKRLTTTPIGFFETEVIAHWPMLMQQLNSKAAAPGLAPLRLRPEKEQELAARLWQPERASGRFRQAGVSDMRLVNRTLSLFQMAAASGLGHEQIPLILQQGLPDAEGEADLWNCAGMLLERWWAWCLARGLLTYSIITELYWRYLLPQPAYQSELRQRFGAVLADDLDEYPAVMRLLLELFLDQGIPVACTFNPIGAARLGLRADPNYMAGLAGRCRLERLPEPAERLGAWSQPILAAIHQPLSLLQLPDSVQVIQSVSKAQLLRQVAEVIGAAVELGAVRPSEIAMIAPGLDPITRYTLSSIFGRRQIPLVSLNSQQPLIDSAQVRALLSLMALVYPGQGRWLNREGVAELLVILAGGLDPVRAGLLADHCFAPDLLQPQLLAVTQFPRWDRLGYQATASYENLLGWLTASRTELPPPAVWLEQAIRQFCSARSSPDQAASLQQLVETAQHYWQVEARLLATDLSEQVSQFIQLLRSGTITANPAASPPPGQEEEPTDTINAQPDAAITLATVYQYRSARCSHRWQFWLDAGSSLWLTGGVMLFGAPLFWRGRPHQVWTAADHLAIAQDNLNREVSDLLNRATERIYLCHCELGINGEEQSGALMPLVDAAPPLSYPEISRSEASR